MFNNIGRLPPDREYTGNDIEKDYHKAMAMLKASQQEIGFLKSELAEANYIITTKEKQIKLINKVNHFKEVQKLKAKISSITNHNKNIRNKLNVTKANLSTVKSNIKKVHYKKEYWKNLAKLQPHYDVYKADLDHTLSTVPYL